MAAERWVLVQKTGPDKQIVDTIIFDPAAPGVRGQWDPAAASPLKKMNETAALAAGYTRRYKGDND